MEFVIASSLFCLFLLFVEQKLLLSVTLLNVILVLSMIFILGIVIGIFHNHTYYDIIRDITHFSKPIIVIITGYLLAQKINSSKFIIKTIIYTASLMAISHLYKIFFGDLNAISVSEIRRVGGADSFIELFALILFFFQKRYNYFKVFNSKTASRFMFLLILISSFLYFSRTMILGFFILYISLMGYTKLTEKAIKYITLFLIIFGVFYSYLFTLELDSESPGIQNLFYKIRNAPAEVFSSPKSYNPRDHKEIFDHWRAYEAGMALEQMEYNILNYVWGKGFGALIDLKFKAPIGGENGLRYIPHLHNGYVYIFFKTGILGLFLYLFMLLSLYRQVYISANNDNHTILLRLISGTALYFIFTSLVITGIYNLQDISVLILGIFLYLARKESNTVTV
ncbi:O-antigen ligase family protein [Mariniflexile sp. HNIBRBA6329]